MQNSMDGPMPSNDMNAGNMIDAQSLFQMIQQIQELAAAGQMEEAMELLAALQSIMENLS